MKHPARPDQPLTYRESLFVEAYLESNCSSLAAFRAAGYRANTTEQERIAARRVLKRPQIRAALERRRQELAMSAAEVLHRLSLMATCSLEDVHDAEGKFSMQKARETGAIHQIRVISHQADGSVRVEMESRKAALDSLARYHGLLADLVVLKDIPKDDEGLNALLLYELRRVRGSLPDGAQNALDAYDRAHNRQLPPAPATPGSGKGTE